MNKIKIYSYKNPISREDFSRVFEILENSFPKTEHRSEDEHFAEFKKHSFRSMVLTDNTENKILGFMNFWELNGFIFLEHFAVTKELRGMGLGTYLMNELKKVLGSRFLILETEPPEQDETAARRVHYYERLGLRLNDYKYVQPPCYDNEQPLALYIMSYPNALSGAEFIKIRNELYRSAYNIPDSSELYSAKI